MALAQTHQHARLDPRERCEDSSECEQLRGADKYRNVCSGKLKKKTIIISNNNKVTHKQAASSDGVKCVTYTGIERASEREG